MYENLDLTVELREFNGTLEEFLIEKNLSLKQLFDLINHQVNGWKKVEDNIYCSNHGTFNIVYCNCHFGSYRSLKRARLAQAIFDESGWNQSMVSEVREIVGEYSKSSEKYIQSKADGFMIMKNINGKPTYFGWFKSLKEAICERDKLIASNWRRC